METSLPPRFEQRVWARIERAEAPGVSPMHAFKAWVEQIFARPAVAFAYVTALVVLGTVVGVTHARNEKARVEHELSARYVQALDPYLRAGI